MKPKHEIMSPADMEVLTRETRSNSRLYSGNRKEENRAAVQEIVTRLAVSLANMPRKVDLKDELLITQIAVAYADACSKSGTIPSKIGFCQCLGVSRQCVEAFLHRHADEPSAERLRMIFDAFAQALNDAALSSAVHPIVTIFLDKALYGFRESTVTEIDIRNDPLSQNMSAEEIAEKYQDLLPE